MITGPTGKRYFGQTTRDLESRWKDHCKKAKQGWDYYFYKAIRKHGSESFIVEPLAVVHNKTDLDFYESFLIDNFDARNPEKGYNTAPGGRGGDRDICHTEDAKKKHKISLAKYYETHPRPSFRQDIPEDTVRNMYLSGLSGESIAKELGFPVCTIQRRIRKMGIVRSPSERNEQIAKTMTQFRKNVFWSCNAPLHPDREKGWWKRDRRRYVPETEGAQ